MQPKVLVGTTVLIALLALMVTMNGDGRAIAGTPAPNVAGNWAGTWVHRVGSGQITLQLSQQGTNVTGRQSVTGVIPVFGGEGQAKLTLSPDIREGTLEDSTLIFNVTSPDAPGGQVNFTLTVSGETMTGTVCGFTCGTLRLKKSST
jgi:hypothetical protein